MKKAGIVLLFFLIYISFWIIDSTFIEKEYIYSVPNTDMYVKAIRNPSKKIAQVFFDDNDFIEIKSSNCTDEGIIYYIDTLEKRIICLEFFDKIKEIHSDWWRIEKFEWRKKMMSYDTDKIRSTISDELNGNYFYIYGSENVLYWCYYDNNKKRDSEMELVEKRRHLKSQIK